MVVPDDDRGALRITDVCLVGGVDDPSAEDTMTWCVGDDVLRSWSSWEEQDEFEGGGESCR